jgi:hypothetical protein
VASALAFEVEVEVVVAAHVA